MSPKIEKVVFALTLSVCLKLGEGLVDVANNAFIQSVDIGKNAILACRSNDNNHVFFFWHNQKKGQVIGPGNDFNANKYDFEVVSGNLTIRGVTFEDEGLYNCVSDGLSHRDFLTSSVHLMIHKDWEEVYETDPNINLMRACVALAIILGFLIVIYIVMRLRQTYRREYAQFNGENEEEEDSTEELFNRAGPSTSGHKKDDSKNNKSPDDFEKVYTTINMTDV